MTSPIGPDPVLLSLIAAAERGEPMPRVRVLAGGWFIEGRLGHGGDFQTRSVRGFRREYLRGPRPEEDRKYVETFEAALAPADGTPSVAVLTLVDCDVSAPTGPSLGVSALRIPVHAVQAWWTTNYRVEKPRPATPRRTLRPGSRPNAGASANFMG